MTNTPIQGSQAETIIAEGDSSFADAGTVFAGATRMLWRACQTMGTCVDVTCVDARSECCHCNDLFQCLVGQAVDAAQGENISAQQPEEKHFFEGLIAAMRDDPEYAWGWHCNLAVPMMDVLDVTHEQANQAAALIMSQMFGVDITTHPQFAYAKSFHQAYFEARISAEREEDAQGMSAGTVETEGLGAKPASPVGGNADAPGA